MLAKSLKKRANIFNRSNEEPQDDKMIERAFQQGIADILGLSDEEISPLSLEQERPFYAAAFSHYEQGDYRGAALLFTQLVLTDPYSEHYWYGLASSKQMQQDYLAATHA